LPKLQKWATIAPSRALQDELHAGCLKTEIEEKELLQMNWCPNLLLHKQ
jgi:hypothetical protein